MKPQKITLLAATVGALGLVWSLVSAVIYDTKHVTNSGAAAIISAGVIISGLVLAWAVDVNKTL